MPPTSSRLKGLFASQPIVSGTVQNPGAQTEQQATTGRLPQGVAISGAPIDRSLDQRFARAARPGISQWSADKEFSVASSQAQRAGRYAGANRAENIGRAKADGTFDVLREKFNRENPGQVMDETGAISGEPRWQNLDMQVPARPAPVLSAEEQARGASVEFGPAGGRLPGTVEVGGVVQPNPENNQGSASIRLPGYENPTSISYSGDTMTATTPGAYSRPAAPATTLPNGLPIGYQGPLASATPDVLAQVFAANPALKPAGYVAPTAQPPTATPAPTPAPAPVTQPAASRLPAGTAPVMTQPFSPSPEQAGLSRLPGQGPNVLDSIDQRIKAAGLDPKSAAAANVRLEDAKTQAAVLKAQTDALKAQEKAAQQAQKAREKALQEAQKVGQEASSRTPSMVSARLSAILGGTGGQARSRLPSFGARK
jgi:hypothetical protein